MNQLSLFIFCKWCFLYIICEICLNFDSSNIFLWVFDPFLHCKWTQPWFHNHSLAVFAVACLQTSEPLSPLNSFPIVFTFFFSLVIFRQSPDLKQQAWLSSYVCTKKWTFLANCTSRSCDRSPINTIWLLVHNLHCIVLHCGKPKVVHKWSGQSGLDDSSDEMNAKGGDEDDIRLYSLLCWKGRLLSWEADGSEFGRRNQTDGI